MGKTFSVILKIVLIIVAVVAVWFVIDFATSTINKSTNKSSFDNPAFRYRIKHTDDLMMDVVRTDENYFAQRFGTDTTEVYVLALKLTQDKYDDMSKRFTYSYTKMLDTMFFPGLKQLNVVKEKKPWFSYKITREYAGENGVKVKTVTIYARDYVYMFFQEYGTSAELLNRLEGSFKSSRTFCFHNIKAVWLDRIGLKGFFLFMVSLILNYGWAFGCFFLCLWLVDVVKIPDKKIFLWVVWVVCCIMIFAYLVLHDSFMDWLMSYDSFIKIPLELFLIFFGED